MSKSEPLDEIRYCRLCRDRKVVELSPFFWHQPVCAECRAEYYAATAEALIHEVIITRRTP